MSSLKQLAYKGVFWTIVGYGAGQVLRLGSNLILTRLLYPELFGLMTIVNIFITGLNLFSDIGLGFSVIQNKRGDEPDFYNTIWTIQILRGLGLWVVCCVLGFPFAQLYNEPQLIWLIAIVGFSSALTSFESIHVFRLDRHMSVRRSTVFDLGVQTISLVTMVVWAYFSPTIWALVSGNLVSAIVRVIWSHRLYPEAPNRFCLEQSTINEVLSFGRWIFLSTALTFVAEQSDRILLGKVFSLEVLGIYGIALTLSDVPRSVTMALAGKVIFPAFAKLVDQPREEFKAKIWENRKLLLLPLTLGIALLAGLGDIATKILYDSRYGMASWMLPLLAVGIWPRLLCTTIDPALLALGKPQYATIGNLTRFLVTTVGIIVGSKFFGVYGAVIAVALNDIFFYAVITYGLCRERLNFLLQDAQFTLLLIAGIAAIIGVRLSIGASTPFDVFFSAG